LTRISPFVLKKKKKKTGSSVVLGSRKKTNKQTNKQNAKLVAKNFSCLSFAVAAEARKHLFVTAFSQAPTNTIASISTQSFVCCLYSKLFSLVLLSVL
jgi:hypothetical protein